MWVVFIGLMSLFMIIFNFYIVIEMSSFKHGVVDLTKEREMLEAQEKIIEKKEGKAVRYFMPVFFKSDCTTNAK
jgi:hypothetical protein